MKILRQFFSFILPITVIIIIPLIIEKNFHFSFFALLIPGIILLAAGFLILSITIENLIKKGNGTLAPWDPTRELVVSGIYSHVRNPMILGVLAILTGEALIFSSINIGFWALLFFIINTIYFMFSEEPALEKKFGKAYRDYKKNVPRWLPRFTSWKPSEKSRAAKP